MNKISKVIIIATILLGGLAAYASSFFGGDIPTGDKLRISTPVFLLNGVNGTVLNISNGGILHSIFVRPTAGNSVSQSFQKIVVSVDGGAERTLFNDTANTYTMYTYTNSAAAGSLNPTVLPLPLAFRTSLVLKVRVTTTAGANGTAMAIYSVN